MPKRHILEWQILLPYTSKLSHWLRAARKGIQFSSVTQSCPALCDPMDCSMPGFPIHHQLPELTETHVHWVGDAIQPSHSLLSSFPSTFNLSQHQGLLNESVLRIRWPKYRSFNFSISPSNEYSGLTSFRINWLDLLTVQGTLKSLLQHHSLKASILWCSAFFTVQLSHPYMIIGKTIALTRWTFVGKVLSLLFSMLSRLVIAFLPRSKRLLISWLQSPSAVILEPKNIKFLTVSIVSPSISHEMMGPDAMILISWMLSFKPAFTHQHSGPSNLVAGKALWQRCSEWELISLMKKWQVPRRHGELKSIEEAWDWGLGERAGRV